MGLDHVLKIVCGIDAVSELATLIRAKLDVVRSGSWMG